MLVLPQEVEMTLNSNNIKYYEDLGYEIPRYYNEKYKRYVVNKEIQIKVNVLDLPKSSHAKVKIICDYCLENNIENIILKENINYLIGHKYITKDCCDNSECKQKKKRETNMIRYGVPYNSQTKEFREKYKNTCLEKYGVEHYSQTEECKEKIKNTSLKHWGTESPTQNEEIKNKTKQTNLNKYGVGSYTQTDECKEKTIETNMRKYKKQYYMQTDEGKERFKQTCQEKYGCDCPPQNEQVKQKIKATVFNKYGVYHISQAKEVRNKVRQTLYSRGTTKCSQQQKYVHNIIGGELNYPINNVSLDIAFSNENIYVECDFGGHWLSIKFGDMTEEEFINKERRRWYFLNSKGWKEIRIISRQDKLPSDEVIFLMIEYAKEYINEGHSWIHFDIDNLKILKSTGNINVDFGKLRRIKKVA